MKPCRFCAEDIQDAAVVCRFCDRPQADVRPVPAPREPSDRPVLTAVLALAVVIAIGAGGFLLGQHSPSIAEAADGATTRLVPDGAGEDTVVTTTETVRRPPPPPPPPATARTTLMDARTFNLDGGQYVLHRFDLRNWRCTLRGAVGVTAGGSHDVDLFVVDDNGLSSFKNGGEFHAYFHRSRTTGDNIDVTLPPGEYSLIVSNRFSWITGKTVKMGSMAVDCTEPVDAGPPSAYPTYDTTTAYDAAH